MGPLTWGLTMPGLLLTGVALCAALIMVATLVVIRHWRRSKGQSPAPVGARGAAAAQARNAVAPHNHDRPRFQRHRAARPWCPGTGAAGTGGAGGAPAAQAVGPQPDPHGPGPAPPTGQRATVRAPTTSQQIASYYDQADKPLADYLTALGWIHQPPHSPQPPGAAERARRHPPNGGPGQ